MVKVCVFGFGKSYEFVKKIDAMSDWLTVNSLIVPTSTYENEWDDLLSGGSMLYLDRENDKAEEVMSDATAHAIDSDKKRYRNKSGEFKLRHFSERKMKMDEFLESIEADLVLFTQAIETPDGVSLVELCKKKNIPTAVPHAARFLGGSFWSNDHIERLLVKDQASRIVKYSENKLPNIYSLPKFKKTSRSLIGQIRAAFSMRVSTFSFPMLMVRLENRLAFIANLRIRIGHYRYEKYCVEALPEKFVFFPLQYTPESSINVPNPYYIDQFRVLDEIRYSLPKNHSVVVKEHPTVVGRRKKEYYKALSRKSHVIISSFRYNSLDLIGRAKCTVSVTGTAAFEAFILGKPSILLGDSFFKRYLENELTDLKEEKLVTPTKIEKSIDDISKYLFDFYALAPDYYDVINDQNCRVLLSSLKQFYEEYYKN